MVNSDFLWRKAMEYDFSVYLLSSKFLNDYPSSQYPELMDKQGRPYNCLLIDTHSDYYICIPYRSYINHKNAFFFKGTKRSQRTKSGLDYSKLVLIKDSAYLDTKQAIVDQDEYNETVIHLPTIVSEVNHYINTYVAHTNGTAVLHQQEYKRKYQFSTLPYFHDILNI